MRASRYCRVYAREMTNMLLLYAYGAIYYSYRYYHNAMSTGLRRKDVAPDSFGGAVKIRITPLAWPKGPSGSRLITRRNTFFFRIKIFSAGEYEYSDRVSLCMNPTTFHTRAGMITE